MDRDFCLNLEETLNLFLPCDYPHDKINLEEFKQGKRGVSKKIIFLVAKILEAELRIVEEFANLACEISSNMDFNAYDCFRLIDTEKKNFINVRK